MSLHKLSPTVASLMLLSLVTPAAPGSTRRGDILIAQARREEAKDTTADMDAALKLATEALATDRLDTGYQLEVARLRAFAAQYHVYEGQVLRDKDHKLKEALVEFEKAAVLDPASEVAPEEAGRTKKLVERLAADPSLSLDELLLRPLPLKNKRDAELFASSSPVPQLKAKLLHTLPMIKVNNQPSNEVFLTLCKQASVRVLFDSDFQPRGLGLNQVIDFHGLSLAQALDYLAMITKSFWKPLSEDTIFVSNDDAQRRGAYEEQVTKAFYLTNAPIAQDVVDIGATVQKVTDMKKLFVHPAQNVIVARSDPDRIALAEKIIADLDKARAEIIIDVVILSVTKDWMRNLGVNFQITSANTNASFAPRAALALPLGATSTPGTTTGTIGSIPLSSLNRLTTRDFTITLPGASLDALLQTSGTKVLDKAQLRTVEGQKSTIRIGQKVPYATGSFSPGALGGTNALVNTQFQYFDIGLNIDVVARVHEPDEVSLHIESDTSSVADRVNLGGILQPVIAQRKRVADVRVKEGEVNFWDVVTDRQDIRNTGGVPGLSQIPLLGRLFTSEHIERSELQVLTLLIPHIIRPPDIRDVNLMSIPSGSDQVVRMRYNREDRGSGTEAPAMVEMPPGNAPNALAAAQPGMPGAAPMGGMPGAQMGGMPGAAPMGGMPGAQMGGMPGAAPMGGMPGAQMGGMPGAAPMGGIPGAQIGGMPGAAPMAGMPGASMGAATAGARLGFDPPQQQAAVNGAVSATLSLRNAVDVGESTLIVQFDPKALRLTGVSPGSMLTSADIAAPPGQMMEDGLVVIKLGKPGGVAVQTTAGPIATFNFQALKAGPTSVSPAGSRVANTKNQEIPSQLESLTVVVQ